MKLKINEVYSITYWQDAYVEIDEDIEIQVSIESQTDEFGDNRLISVTVLDSQDIPDGISEEDIIDFVTNNY